MTRKHILKLLSLTCIIAGMFCFSAIARSSNTPIPSAVISAKSVYIVNETGNSNVLKTAYDRFKSWGKFTIVNSRDDADIVVVFAYKNGIDQLGFVGFIKMDVFLKGDSRPVFETKKAGRTIFEPQLRTINCIADFEKHLEHKN
jgi:hypothetical protein